MRKNRAIAGIISHSLLRNDEYVTRYWKMTSDLAYRASSTFLAVNSGLHGNYTDQKISYLGRVHGMCKVTVSGSIRKILSPADVYYRP